MTRITTDESVLKDKSLNFVDMHHHSTVSDGTSTPEFLYKVAKKKGFGLCIMDHNQIKGSLYLAKQKDFFTIPCVEITSRQSKDVLAYFRDVRDLISFWESEIKGKIRNRCLFNCNRTTIDVFDLPQMIEDHNGIAVLPHPLAMRPKDNAKLLDDSEFMKRIKAIESHNFGLGKYEKTVSLLSGSDKPFVAGSDSHTVSAFETLTATKHFDRDSFLDALLKKQNVIYYKEGGFIGRIREHLAILKNNMHLVAPKNE